MEMEEILSSLANQDAIKIFQTANSGITSSTETIEELGLTQKRYYSRLRQLIEAGLIEKIGDAYKHTIFGKLCYRLGEKFLDAVTHRDRLDLMDRLNKSKTISTEETKAISQAISLGGVGGFSEADLISTVTVVDTWDKVVQEVIQRIEKAEKNIFFATQYFDMRVVEALLRAAERDIDMNFLIGKQDTVKTAVNIVLRSLIGSPDTIKFLIQFMNSSKLKVRMIDLPYTFVVFDEKWAMIEIAKPFTKAFSLAFFLSNVRLCGRLVETFEILWNRSKENGLLNKFIKKKLK
jgi:predicted transcriptional regulator